MRSLLFSFFILTLFSCTPTMWQDLEVAVPAPYTFPDSGKVAVLNASLVPDAMFGKSNMMTEMTASEKYIYDTIITNNLFNGFFWIMDGSPSDYLYNIDYFESRRNDTLNIFQPIPADTIKNFIGKNSLDYLITLEYYDFRGELTQVEDEWGSNLQVQYRLIWRIYGKEGDFLNQFLDSDTTNWFQSQYFDFSVPEMTDAVREVFFEAGSKFAKQITPSWHTISRNYYLILAFGPDISLNKEKLLEIRASGKPNKAYRACFNLAVLSESEDKLDEAYAYLQESIKFKKSVYADYYIKALEKRLEYRTQLDKQTGHN
jgi:hypothetical protein